MYVNESLAKDYGLEPAILLQNFAFWVTVNAKKNINLRDGKIWTFISIKTLQKQFPFLSVSKIRAAIIKLKQSNILITANYNRNKYDRTIWYAFENEDFLKKIISDYLSVKKACVIKTNAFVKNETSICKNRKPIQDKEDNINNIEVEEDNL